MFNEKPICPIYGTPGAKSSKYSSFVVKCAISYWNTYFVFASCLYYISIKYLQAMDLPKTGIIVDIEKEILLQFVGSYPHEYQRATLHIFVPWNDFCSNTFSGDICKRTSLCSIGAMFELPDIMSSTNTIASDFHCFEDNFYINDDTDQLVKVNYNDNDAPNFITQ